MPAWSISCNVAQGSSTMLANHIVTIAIETQMLGKGMSLAP